MGENSAIEWCDHTFNPWIGCTKVSPACDHCYAEARDTRFKHNRWGAHADRTRTSDSNWNKPLKWNRETNERKRVFAASLADIFDNHRSIEWTWRRDFWFMLSITQNLDWLVLTKRPQNIKSFLPDGWGDGWSNVQLGFSAENQTEYDRRKKAILSVPARRRFVSMEPLLGPIECGDLTGIHQVIVGGENCQSFRHMDDDWVRCIRDTCAAQNVAFLFKQYGGRNRTEIKAKGRLLDGVVHDGYPAPLQADRGGVPARYASAGLPKEAN